MNMPRFIAIDTETLGLGGAPWSVQYSLRPGSGTWVSADDAQRLAQLNRVVGNPRVLTVVHNALFDLRVMAELGVYPAHVLDTMIMAYLLGEDSLKLKVLAYRYAGMEMRTYEEVVEPESARLALPWLEQVAAMEWPDSEPVIEENPDGTVRVRQPQNLSKRLGRFLKRYAAGTAKKGLVEYWDDKKMDADREMVEPVLGTIPVATLADVDRAAAVAYACSDSDATMRIFPPLYDRIVQAGMVNVLERDMAVLPMVVEMMQTGMGIDRDYLIRLGAELELDAERLHRGINRMAGGYLNPGSPPQVLAALIKRGLEIRSTEATELDKHRGDELVRLVQDCRAARKLKSTYADVLPTKADRHGRIHTSLSATRTATGRYASSNPNIQNIPVRTEMGRKIRDGFVAGEGNSLISIDLSQIELRYAAHESQDPTMMEAYWTGKDIHRETAMAMFGIAANQVDPYKHRRPAKVVNFGVIYFISAPGLLVRFYHEDITDFTVDDCAAFIEAWRNKYLGYFEWAEETKAYAIRHGYVVDMFGRRRYVPEVYSADARIREGGYREAINGPIQSGAGGFLKEAMRLVWVRLLEWRKSGGLVLPLMQIHDELMFEVEDALVDAVVYEFAPTIAHAVELTVPVEVGVKVGKRWGSMKELGSSG